MIPLLADSNNLEATFQSICFGPYIYLIRTILSYFITHLLGISKRSITFIPETTSCPISSNKLTKKSLVTLIHVICLHVWVCEIAVVFVASVFLFF